MNWKSPKWHLRALCKSCRKHPEAPHDTFLLLHLPAVCNAGGMPKLLLISIQCRWCDFHFCICRSCFRGQAYCCDECRSAGKRKNQSKAQRKYRQTPKGKKNHCESENRRRHGNTQRIPKNMDDATSTARRPWAMKMLTHIKSCTWRIDLMPFCHFCGIRGRIVSSFPRRGYG